MAQFPDPTFRTATEEDVPRLLEIHLAAYPSPYDVAKRRRNFVAHPFGALENLTVAEIEGDLVAHAFLFPLKAWFGGAKVGVGGIASVAVAPEARGRGIGRALMRRLHEISDVRGDAITMLYPFREGFYAALGYAPTTPRHRLSFDPRAVPEAWCELARTHVRRARGDDRDTIENLHREVASKASGWIVREQVRWDRLFARERRQHFVTDGGYVAFVLHQEHVHAETTILVDELVAATDFARLVLYGALGAMRDQVHEVVIEVALDDPITHALVDADRRRFGTEEVEHSLGEIVAGPMVRIEDVHRALESRGYPGGEGAFDVVVDDEIAMAVTVEGGRATIAGARGGPALRARRDVLAAILYGGLRASQAAGLGFVEAEPRLLERIDAIAAIPPIAAIDPF
jgi:predicted acetyltransferase